MKDSGRDLFEDLAQELGCAFISDMRFHPWREKARWTMSRIDLKPYCLAQMEDMAGYLYGETVAFDSYRHAETYFAEKLRTQKREGCMEQEDFLNSVADRLGCSQEMVFAIYQAFLDTAAERLSSGQAVALGGLGTLEPRLRDGVPREESPRSPRQPHYTVVFRPSRELKKRLRGNGMAP